VTDSRHERHAQIGRVPPCVSFKRPADRPTCRAQASIRILARRGLCVCRGRDGGHLVEISLAGQDEPGDLALVVE